MNYSDDLIGQRQQRMDAVKKLRELGINPYPAKAKKDHPNQYIHAHFSQLENKEITLTGRLMARREHGKLLFGDLVDQSGKIQICLRQDILQEDLKLSYLGWSQLSYLDVGDFLQVTGKIGKTQAGEITLFVKHLKLLTKSLRPLPNSFAEKDQRFRKRYLDFTLYSKHRALFARKAKFWQVSREFMKTHGFIELETPILELVTGGADAKPFTTHHNALDQDFYLRISSELFQKRLIGGGFEKIFVLGPNFRNEGIDDEHLQEYYQLEWYWAYADYRDNMMLVRDLFRHVAQEVYGKTKFTTRGHTFDLMADWQEIDYSQIIKQKFDIDIFQTSEEKMLETIKKQGIELVGAVNRNRIVDNLWKIIRKSIAGPAYLIKHPKFNSPLAKSIENNPQLTERFQVLIAGSELGSGYSEINDPIDQLDRFLEQQKMRDAGDDEAQMLDIDFVEMLEYGMPPTSGYGHSERIFWFLENITAREGTLFPQLKQEIEETTKKIYQGQVNFSVKQPQKEKMQTQPTVTKATGLLSREEAQKLVEKHIQNDYQCLHALMVAKSLEAYAAVYGGDADLWYITGLLHDLDYYEYPQEHPNKAASWFKEWNYPKELIQAVAAHAQDRTGVKPQSKLDFTLIACDELAGLLYAYSLMRPTGFVGMEAKSAKKKFKDKAFAAKVNRQEIQKGIDGLQIDLKEHIQKLIDVYKQMSEFINK
ncbi:lysine--tRNA ligase [Candidatus Roizmanbacteria bacterium RIFCSPLOWO2_01_FULL_41_22]|uniref:Lysine--tRNA ligase n=1 Tax=Candidatus Roizmanbacteria bacterium RIFCSPLOWO2_01_FULL_41_22 TaxID=1802067 RepID=A0A1F7J6A8_9BACT|nr:MAG: lysine--tRNA ligase [Candidatus Roizmanbacteria bacterium RIFCSPLOWO2_01_FULL_41_22]